MRFATLPDGTRCSVLGFGCGAVMGRVGRADSLRAMEAAFDAGVNVFDTARSYGYGDSEAVLGEFLAGRRSNVLVSTKFGVEPGQRQGWKSMLRPVARRVLKAFPQARQAMRRQAAGQIQQASLTPAAMRTSLETSLRCLRTDYVDFFFLHDVAPEAMRQEDLFAELALLRDEGKVRRFGVSSSVESAAAVLDAHCGVSAVQMPVNLTTLARAVRVTSAAVEAGCAVLANNIFGGVDGAAGSLARLRLLGEDASLSAAVRERLTASQNLLAEVLLPLALRQAGAHCAIVSMMSLRNVSANVQAVAVDRWSAEELTLLLQKLI
jgi:aryl-alcohol dehydrogenase-like predicted oxidoreductase